MASYSKVSVLELKSFTKASKKILNNKEKEELRSILSQNPKAGDIIPNTSGLRKYRYKINNHKGKSGGSRVIYYYHNNDNPLLLVFMYQKSKIVNLTKEQEKILKNAVKEIVDKEFK